MSFRFEANRSRSNEASAPSICRAKKIALGTSAGSVQESVSQETRTDVAAVMLVKRHRMRTHRSLLQETRPAQLAILWRLPCLDPKDVAQIHRDGHAF